MEYNSLWPAIYASEEAKIIKAMGENLYEIHHIGSTAVPGLAAKPKIDIIVGCIDQGGIVSAELLNIGYVDRGSFISGCRDFTKRSDIKVNLHIFLSGDENIAKAIKFRDYLRINLAEAKKYEALKKDLAKKYYQDGSMQYCHAKSDFIEGLLTKII